MNLLAQVKLSDGTLAVFLGYQDDERFGFFREVADPDTFFGWRMSKLVQIAT